MWRLSVKKIIRNITALICISAMMLSQTINVRAADPAGAGTVFGFRYNDYPKSYISTQTTVINGIYFTVDTYHDRIIYSDTGVNNGNLFGWKVMADDLNKPHSICSDGDIYLVTDTDNNRVVTYGRFRSGEFVELQSFENVGIRPHYSVYDQSTGVFYVWSSYTGEMYLYSRISPSSNKLKFVGVKKLSTLYGLYTRSFTIDGNYILLCSQGAGAIIAVDKKSFTPVAVYPVCDDLCGMVQIAHVGGHYYLSTSSDKLGNQNKAIMARSDSLAGFGVPGMYTDVTAQFGGISGILVPYYMTPVGDVYIARFIGMVGGYDDFAVSFTEDALGNIVIGTEFP